MSPTQRALAFCKEQGWEYEKATWWDAYAHRTKDLCGVIDYIVFDGLGGGPLGVQITSGDNHAARRTKAEAEPRLAHWLAAPARFEVWSYSKTGARGKRKLWTLRREPVVVMTATAVASDIA